MSDLKNKTVSAVFWTAIESGFIQISKFIVVLVLSRILSPSDFGLIAMTSVFILLGETIANSGLKSALVRKLDISQKDLSTAFYYNITIAGLIYVILYFVSGFIADFYNQPQLEIIVKFVSINIFFNALGLVQNVIATKAINFKLLTIIQVLSVVIAGITGIFMAVQGYGVWALVTQTITNNFLKTFLIWIAQRWKPTLVFSKESFKYLFGFGMNILARNLIEKMFQQLSTIVIGKFYSSSDLGYYSQAKRLQSLPSNSLNDIVRKVSYPVFSKIQNDDQKLKSGFSKALQSLVFLNFPLMMWLMVVGKTFIVVVMTEKWLPVVPYLQFLCIVGMLLPFNSLNINIIVTKGFPRLALRLEIIKKVIMVIAIIITVRIGILAIVIGEVISGFIAYLINSYYPGKLVDYSIKKQFKDILPYLLISTTMAISLIFMKFLFLEENLFSLIVLTFTGILIYISLGYYFKLTAMTLLVDSIKKIRDRFN